MKKIKSFILIGLIILVSGCTADYNITIDSKERVTEKLIIHFNNNEITDSNISEHIDNRINSYDTNNYSIEKNIGKQKSNVALIRTYNSLEDYRNNSELYKEAFEDIAILSSYDYNGMQTIGEYRKERLFGNGIDLEPLFNDISINVKLYNNLVENNANNCNINTNVCTWKLNNEIDKFYLQFKYNNSKRYDIIIKEYLKNNWFGLVIVTILIIGAVIITTIIKKRDNLSNKI